MDPHAPAAVPAGPDSAEAHWLEQVYVREPVPQLTVRAVLTGGVIGMLMSIGNFYTIMKVGLGFGVAVSACAVSFAAWQLLHLVSGGRTRQLSILENNCMQTTASAAGYSTASTLAVTFAALMILDPEHRHQPWWVVAAFTTLTALLGVLLAIPLKRLYINLEQLPFPTGTAAATTLRGLYSRSQDAARTVAGLLWAMAAGAVSAVLTTAEDQFEALRRFFLWMRTHLVNVNVAGQFPEQGFAQIGGKPLLGYAYDPSLSIMAFGIIVGPRVAFSMLASSLALYALVAPWLHQIDLAQAGVEGYVASLPAIAGGALYHPVRWALWGGASLLTFASLTTLALQWRTVARAFQGLGRGRQPAQDDVTGRELAQIEVPGAWMVAGLVPVGIGLVVLQVVAFRVSWWAGLVAVVLSFAIGLVVARAAGETDVAPTGALGKIMQLVFAFVSPPGVAGVQASVVQNVFSAGVASNSATAGTELLSDLKTGYLLGANPRKQFVAQLFGVAFGVLVSVPAWYLMVPNMAALEQYPAPASQIWVAMAKALMGGLFHLPQTVLVAVLAGAVLGIGLPLLERLLPRARRWLPSATGLGLAWVVPFSVCLSFAIGATLSLLWRKASASSHERHSLAVASGLIAGESIVKAGLAMLASALVLMG